MFSFRSIVILSFATFCWGANLSAQTFSFQPQQPAQSQQAVQQQRMQQIPVQQQPVQQQPMQAQPMQAPLFGTPGMMQVQQQQPGQFQPTLPPVVPQGQTQAWQPNGQPTNMQQPVLRVAAANPGQPVGQPISLYTPSGVNQMPQTVQQPAAQGTSQGVPQGMTHVGRAEPANRVVPFFLLPEEQRELDEFLVRWERVSATVQRYEVNFNLFMHDQTVPGAQPRIAFGYFKYNANPRRFVYELEGEWQGEPRRQIRRDDRNPHILAEKIIIDERSVHQYDYNAQVVRQVNVPPEMIGRGIADSPLPLIFGAKADDLKRRFSMRIVPVPGRDDLVWLHARPLFIEDQQEFKELEIMLDRRNLTAVGLKQWDINGKTYRSFQLETPRINPRVISVLEDIREFFTADVPRGWRREVVEWVAPPPPVPSMQQPRVANPPQHHNHGGEVPLYRVQ